MAHYPKRSDSSTPTTYPRFSSLLGIGGAGQFVVRIGRWKPGSGRVYLSEFVPSEELDDVCKRSLRRYASTSTIKRMVRDLVERLTAR